MADGGNYGYLSFYTNGGPNVTIYDLTANTLQNINNLYGGGDNLTLKINSADAAGVSNFYAGGANDQLVTSDATLDLSHSEVSNFAVLSSGTLSLYGSGTFRVDQLATFSGFSTITLNNYTNGTASLYLTIRWFHPRRIWS